LFRLVGAHARAEAGSRKDCSDSTHRVGSLAQFTGLRGPWK
jgi:hypothetical protein